MIALLDINFLIALFDSAHVHHAAAESWFMNHRKLGWATCPLSENGCIRILSQPNYSGGLALAEVSRRLKTPPCRKTMFFGRTRCLFTMMNGSMSHACFRHVGLRMCIFWRLLSSMEGVWSRLTKGFRCLQ